MTAGAARRGPALGTLTFVSAIPCGSVRLGDAYVSLAREASPAPDRARRLRGELIRRANLKGKNYRVDWVYLKLNDPERETILCKVPFPSRDERVERLIRSS